MIEYRIASPQDLSLLLELRLKMLRDLNRLPADHPFPQEVVDSNSSYFSDADQTTILATDAGEAVGCATACYYRILPTFSNLSGRQAHFINVYTCPAYRGQGIASHILRSLVDAVRERGITEIVLDATPAGKPLYEKLGFVCPSGFEHMAFHLSASE